MKEHKSMLCVGGPLDGRRFAARSGSGFRVPVREPMPDSAGSDFRPNATVEVHDAYYREETMHTPQGDVSFWVPTDQTPLQTLTRLLEVYEAAQRPK